MLLTKLEMSGIVYIYLYAGGLKRRGGMNMENKKRSSFISVLLIILCLSLCAGATYAYFTDRVESSNNIIKTGKIDVTMEWANGTANPTDENTPWTDASEGAIFNYDLWEPGYVDVYHIKIANIGTLAFKYNLVVVANGEVSVLADVIDVYYFDPAVQLTNRSALVDANKVGCLTDVLKDMGKTTVSTLKPGEAAIVTIALKMREDAGNRYQELSIGTDFSIQLHATQLNFESDAFDSGYDEDAEIPCEHVPDLWYVSAEPTTTKEGEKQATCTVCGRTIKKIIPIVEKSTVRFTLSDDKTYYIASGLNDTSAKDVVIPATYNEMPVREIAENGFAGYYEITSVTIPEGVTTIGNRAFYNCDSLETVTIPYSATTMGKDVFISDHRLTIYYRDEAIPTDWDSNWNLIRSYYDEELGEDVNEFVPVVLSWSHGAEYTYTFVTNSEDCELDSITSAAIITLPAPYKEGYIFAGWYTDADLTQKVTSSTYHSTTEHTLYAKWITLAECFASATELKLDEQKRVDITVQGQQAYFVFTPEESGWYAFCADDIEESDYSDTYGYLYGSDFGLLDSDDDSGNSAHFQIVYELEAGVTYYLAASFYPTSRICPFNVKVTVPVTYTIDADGGEKEYGELPQQIVSTFEITLPTLYKDGYVFGGWYETSDFTSEPLTSQNYIREENCALYAKWISLADCRANASEITVGEAELVDITFAGQTVFYKFKTPITDDPVYYRFSSSDIDGEERYSKDAYLYDSNRDDPICEYDYWSSNFDFSYQLEGNRTYYLAVTFRNGNATGSFNVTVAREYTYTFVTSPDWDFTRKSTTGIYLPNPSESNGIFGGWYENPEFTGQAYAAGEYYFKGTDCTLYAKYLTVEELLTQGTQIENISLEELGKPYTVNITTGGQRVYFSFTVPGDAFSVYTFSLTGERDVALTFYDSNADFYTGYYTNVEIRSYEFVGGETYYVVTGLDSEDEIGSYTITINAPTTYTFKVDGGVDEYGNPIENITSSTEIWLPTPTKEGSIFRGWYDNPEFNGDVMKANERYYSGTNCTLYAKWMTAEDILEQTVGTLETCRYFFANLIDGTQVNYFMFAPEFSGTYHFYLKGSGKLYDSNLRLIDEGEANAANGGLDFKCYLNSSETYYLFVERYSIDGYVEPEIKFFAPIATYTFVTNGGDPIENYVVTDIGTPLPIPVKTDAIFLGWYDNEALEGEALNSKKYFCTIDCTLFAKWVTLEELQDPKYAISLGETYEIDIETAGEKVLFAFTATKNGTHAIETRYWVKCSVYNSALEEIACVHHGEDYYKCEFEAGKTYYLIFESNSEYNYGTSSVTVLPTIKYTFDANGGIILGEESYSSISIDGIWLSTPTKEGAIFLGWYTDPDCKEGGPLMDWYNSNTDCTLYAKWIDVAGVADCAIPMTLGNASSTEITTRGQTVFYSFTVPTTDDGKYGFFSSSYCNANVTIYNSALESIDFGYDYNYNNGFSIASKLKGGETYYLVINIYYLEEAFTLDVIVDVAYTYQIIMDSYYEEDYTITSATEIMLGTPYNGDYIFDGWYKDATFEIKVSVDEDGKYSNTGDCILYAKWIDPFDQATTMTLGTTYTVDIVKGGECVYYLFTPAESQYYTFESSKIDPYFDIDPRATLYDSTKEYISDDDDGAGDCNFLMTIYLEAGNCYYLEVSLWDSEQTDPFYITVSAN